MSNAPNASEHDEIQTYSVKETAMVLGFSASGINRAWREGKIKHWPFIMIDRKKRLPKKFVDSLLTGEVEGGL